MRKSSIVPVLLGLALLSPGCDRDSSGMFPPAQFAYSYKGFDSTGAPVVQGTIVLSPVSTGSPECHEGTRDLRAVGTPPPPNLGPQLGSGQLVWCTFYGDPEQVRVFLNPESPYPLPNVSLVGRLSRSEFSGTWEFAGLPGSPLNEGTFVATRL